MPTPEEKVAKQKAKVRQFSEAAKKQRAKIEKAQKRLRWAVAKRAVHRKKLKQARIALRHSQQEPRFQVYMLNGCPGNITQAAKAAIARGVIKFDCTVTATTNGTHTSTSFHYPYNNASHGYSDALGHAVDFGGPWGTYNVFYASEKNRGCQHYDELFGPGSGYCKSHAAAGGAAPDNPNHVHNAPVP